MCMTIGSTSRSRNALSWRQIAYLIGTLAACSSDPVASKSRDAGQAQPSNNDSSISACNENADCAKSTAADKARDLKCLLPEVYCLQNKCAFGCGAVCTVARVDVNPCDQGICAPSPYQGSKDMSFCTMLPVKCDSTSDCPRYLPSVAGGQDGSWTCEGGVCTYPGFDYPTR
jgi:hypothetical protein